MKYNLNIEHDRISAQNRLNKFKVDGSMIELKKINPSRSIQSNKYLHVCLSLYAIEFGYTLDEAKTDLKRLCPFMVYEKKGKKFIRHTSQMDSLGITDFIEWVRNYSAVNGLYIPSPSEYMEGMIYIDNLINSHKEYL